MNDNAKYWIGMAASVLAALGGSAHLLPEPYSHVLMLAGIAGSAASGYMIQRQPSR